MPTKQQLIRFWCSKCQEFTVHQGDSCLTCGTVTNEYLLSDVPIEKLEAQRERYKRMKQRNSPLNAYLNILGCGSILHGNGIPDSFNKSVEEANQENIIETDAGQKTIDKKRTERLEKLREERRAREEEYLKFKGTGRNDLCPCGSGKKYKTCCQPRFFGI